jgi:hypothetical protein
MQKYEPIDLGFYTADGDRPELQFVDGDILFSFVSCLDRADHTVTFTATDVRAFSWLEELDVRGIRDDQTYEVLESDLIRTYMAWNHISPGDGYRHFKLCFNAAGVFDVVCKAIALA